MTREEAIERMKTMRWEHATNPSPDREAFDMAISALSADVRPNIHGHWIDKMNDYLGYVTHCECSECGYTVRKAYAVEYIGCPYCLADMREPKGEKGTE